METGASWPHKSLDRSGGSGLARFHEAGLCFKRFSDLFGPVFLVVLLLHVTPQGMTFDFRSGNWLIYHFQSSPDINQV